MECIFNLFAVVGGLELSHVPGKAGLSTDGPGGLSLVGFCKASGPPTPAIFAWNDSVIPYWQSAEPEGDRPLQRHFQGPLIGKG